MRLFVLWVMLLSKKGDFFMRNKEWDGDVFWAIKMSEILEYWSVWETDRVWWCYLGRYIFVREMEKYRRV